MAWNKMDIGEIDTLWLMCSTRSQRCDGLSGCLTSCYLITGSVVVENIKGLLEKISYSPHSRMDRVAHPSGHVHDGWAQTTFSSILPCEVCPLLLSDDQKEWCWHPHKKKDHKISGTIFFFFWLILFLLSANFVRDVLQVVFIWVIALFWLCFLFFLMIDSYNGPAGYFLLERVISRVVVITFQHLCKKKKKGAKIFISLLSVSNYNWEEYI